jgi:hypothetical protein
MIDYLFGINKNKYFTYLLQLREKMDEKTIKFIEDKLR